MCVKGRPGTNKVLPNCWNNVGAGDCSDDKRKTFKLFEFEGFDELNEGIVYTHKSCVCNERVALEQRHQVDDGSRYTSNVNLKKYLRPFIGLVSPVSEEHIISRCSGEKRNLMLQAQSTLQLDPVDKRDSKVKMFLKDDKYLMGTEWVGDAIGVEVEKPEYGAPRCIQYRNKRYCLRLATYLHAIEEHVYKQRDEYDTLVFAKSRNLSQRAQDLFEKWSLFVKPKALLLDHSKFDAHCSLPLLKLEHWFYGKCNDSPELADLLRWQLYNVGRTKNDTRYGTTATRMSGDQNTGLGNSLINYAILKAFVCHYKLKASIYVDGDDSVVIFEDSGQEWDNMDFFKQFGMKTKFSTTTNFSHVEFCQTRPVYDGQAWHCVRNPYRLLVRTPWTVKERWAKRRNDYLASIGRCEMALGMGLPIGQYLGSTLAALSSRHVTTDLEYVARRQYVKPLKAKVVPPTAECRASYEEAWGVSPDMQERIEKLTIRLPVLDYEVEETPFLQ